MKICIGNLVGLPAAGKTTFCHEIIKHFTKNQYECNVLHISYDNFIDIPNDIAYFEHKIYKKNRLQLAWIIDRIIKNFKTIRNIEFLNEIFNRTYPQNTFNCIKSLSFNLENENCLLLIDDNMYYKSMRKQIRNIAIENEIGYFLINFRTTLNACLNQNSQRLNSIPNEFIEKMKVKFEQPQRQEGFLFNVGIDNVSIELFQETIQYHFDHPLVKQEPLESINVPQSELHRIDLILRKTINRKMNEIPSDNRSKVGKVLCGKRVFILKEFRCGHLGIVDFNESDAGMLFDQCT